MITKIVLMEEKVEVGFPGIVVGGGVGEGDGNVIREEDVADVGGKGLFGFGAIGRVKWVAWTGGGGSS